MMNTLTAHCQWEDEMVRERAGLPPHMPYYEHEVANTLDPWLPQG